MTSYLDAKGWLTKDERELLFLISREAPPDGLIVNIGVEYGASIACLRAGNPQTPIIGIDVDNSKYEGPAHNVSLITEDSRLVIDAWRSFFDVIFIDGDHSYEGVKTDIRFLSFLKVGGFVLFHDCYSWEDPGQPHKIVPEVNQAVSDWASSPAVKSGFDEYEAIGSIRIFKKVK